MKTLQGNLVKNVLVGLFAGGAVLAAAAYAMPDAPGPGNARCEQRGQQLQSRIEQRKQHMADLKEKLNLSPSQEAAWSKFVDSAKLGQRHMGSDKQAMREEFKKLNTIERMEKIQAMKEMRHARMAERMESLKAFYAQLTPEQQKVFDAEMMNRRHERMRHHQQFQS